MTDHSELIARLENSAFSPASPAGKDEREAAAALREQAREIAQAWAMYEVCKETRAALQLELKAAKTERDTLASEIAGLREALSEFGAHLSDCAWIKGYDAIEGLAWEKCDCGLDAAMEPKSKP